MVQLTCPSWKLIFTTPGVYGLLLQSLLHGAGFYVVYTCYPTYMKTVLNYDITQVSVSLLVDLFVFVCMYFMTAYVVLAYCEHGGVDLMGLKPSP